MKNDSTNNLFIRLRTDMWYDTNGCYLKKNIRFLRRMSNGNNFLYDDLCNIGANDVVPRIINLDECDDGIYIVTMCDIRRDYETGQIDDYNYTLTLINME